MRIIFCLVVGIIIGSVMYIIDTTLNYLLGLNNNKLKQ